jgi:NEDD8-activating enzyme E1 regulatory subunit
LILNVADLSREEQEFSNDEMAAESMMPLSLLPVYLALRATSHVSAVTPDEVLAKIKDLVPNAGDNERVQQAAEEVFRAAGGELHNISAVTGGMVAQEMIKIITKQYIPIDNTCIFDGIRSRCQVLHL